MKRLAVVAISACFIVLLPSRGSALDIWHSGSGFIQGFCSYEFTLDGQREQFESSSGITNLVLGIDGINKNDEEHTLGYIEIELGPFADSDATRYVKAYWEGDCDADAFLISKAVTVMDWKERDLLRENALVVLKSPLIDAAEIRIEPLLNAQ